MEEGQQNPFGFVVTSTRPIHARASDDLEEISDFRSRSATSENSEFV